MWAFSSCASPSSRLGAALYAAPAFALAIPLVPAQVLVPSLYATQTAVGLATVGLVLFLARIVDIASDPVVGWLTDCALSAGRGFRFLILCGAVLCGGSLVQLFTPPQTAGWFYLFSWSALLFVGWSAVQIPYTLYSARLSDIPQDRLRLNGAREGVGLLGIVAAALFVAFWPAQSALDRLNDLASAAILFGAVSLGLLAAFLPVPRSRALAPHRKAFTWCKLLRNKPAIRLVAAWFLNAVANGLPAICFPLFVSLVLGAGEETRGRLLLIYFMSEAVSVPLWVLAGKRVDKHRLWCLAMLVACLTFATVPMIGAGGVLWFGLVCLLTGMAFGADLALPPAMQADVVDWDYMQSRQDRAGLLFSIWSASTKVAFGLAAGIAFPLLQAFGVDSQATQTTSGGSLALVVIYSVVPIVIKLGAIALVWSFPLTARRMASCRKRLVRI